MDNLIQYEIRTIRNHAMIAVRPDMIRARKLVIHLARVYGQVDRIEITEHKIGSSPVVVVTDYELMMMKGLF